MSRIVRSGSPDPRAPGFAIGITEVTICDLVHAFYARVRRDEVLAPVFETEVEDWRDHLDTMCAFWSSVTLMTGRYKGQPMAVHVGLPEIDKEHFERWLALFREAAAEVCPAGATLFFVDRAERIAQSLQAGIALHQGQSLVAPLGQAQTNQPQPEESIR